MARREGLRRLVQALVQRLGHRAQARGVAGVGMHAYAFN